MKTLLVCLFCTAVSLTAHAQAVKTSSTQLAASFDKDKAKSKSKYGVTKQVNIITRHTVVDVPGLTGYSGHYVGIEGRYELTLDAGADGKILGRLLEPTLGGQTTSVKLSNVKIQKGIFTAEGGGKTLEGVFLKQIRTDNGQESTSLGLGMINPNLPNEGVTFNHIFCAKKGIK